MLPSRRLVSHASVPDSRRSGVRPQRPRLSGLFNTDYYIHWRATGLLCDGGIWDGARRGAGAPEAAGGVSIAGAGTRQWVLGQARAGTELFVGMCKVLTAGARRRPVLVSARAGNINRVGFDESMYKARERTAGRLGFRGLDRDLRDDFRHGAAVLGIIQAGVLDLLGDAQ